jgi:hypothetical protein
MAAETQAEQQQQQAGQQPNGNGQSNGGHKTAVRAAAIAAATGATAFAAKKAFSGRGGSAAGEEKQRRATSADDDSMFGAMLTSGWDAARDSLVPFAEDAAGAAGEWVARNGPELVTDTLVPRFIRGFESARRSSDDSSDE